jgi:hypothetical protein
MHVELIKEVASRSLYDLYYLCNNHRSDEHVGHMDTFLDYHQA